MTADDIRLQRGTAALWAERNPVLLKGEPGYAWDTHVLKVGDGVLPWLTLPSVGASPQASDIAQVHIQDVPSASWTIPHTLGRLPGVTLYIDGELVDADIMATTAAVSISLPVPFSGVAVLN